jgi:hypothetical protein
MTKARFLVYKVQRVSGPARRPVAGLYAPNIEKANVIVQELFGPDFEAARFSPPPGWKNDPENLFYTQETRLGVRYKCKACHKDTLKLGRHNHWPWCTWHHESFDPHPPSSVIPP